MPPPAATPPPEGPSRQGYWRLVWRQFKRNRMAVAALIVLLLLGLIGRASCRERVSNCV